MRRLWSLGALPALVIVAAGCGPVLDDLGGTVAPAAASAAGSVQKDGPKSPVTYEVALHRPDKVGARHRISSVVTKTDSKVLSLGGTPVKRESSKRVLHFVAVERVTGVNGRGQTTSAEYVIEQFEAEVGQKRTTVIAKGRVLTVKRGDPPVLTLDRGTLSEEARQYVDDVLPLSPPDPHTDDEIFGSARKRAIGARWPIDRAKAAKNLSDKGMTVRTRDLSGETELVGTRSERGIPCLELGAKVLAKVSSIPGMPAGAKVKRGRIDFEFHGLFPNDVALQPLSQTSKMTGDFLVAFEVEGKQLSLDLDMEMVDRTERVALP